MFIAILLGTRNNSSLRGVFLLPSPSEILPINNPDGLCMDVSHLQFPLSELVHAGIEFAVFNSRSDAYTYLSEHPHHTIPATGSPPACATHRPVPGPLPVCTPLRNTPPPPPVDIVANVIKLQREKIQRRTSARIQQLQFIDRRKQNKRDKDSSPPPPSPSPVTHSVSRPTSPTQGSSCTTSTVAQSSQRSVRHYYTPSQPTTPPTQRSVSATEIPTPILRCPTCSQFIDSPDATPRRG
jgi:hypothetical protein